MSKFPHGGDALGAQPGHLLLAPVLRPEMVLSRQQALLDLQAIQRIPGLAGYWSADPAYLYEDSAGTIPANTNGTGVVGCWRRVGDAPVYTPVTINNPGFDTDTGWTKGTGWSIADGVATHVGPTSGNLSQAVSFAPGATYLITWTMTRTAGSIRPVFFGGTAQYGDYISASGTYSENLVAATGNTTLVFEGGADFAGAIDNVTLVAVSNSPGLQATTANKPYLRKTPTSGVYWLDSNTSTSALTATLGNLGASCTVARAGAEGVTFTEGVTISSTYNIAPAFGFNGDIAIFNRALTTTEKALLTRYMQRGVPVLGANLITNGTFDTDTTGWAPRLTYGVGATSVTDGVVSITGNGVDIYGGLVQVPVPVGATGTQYFVTGDVKSISGTNASFRVLKGAQQASTPAFNYSGTNFTTLKFSFSQSTTGVGLLLSPNSATGIAAFDNIALRTIL